MPSGRMLTPDNITPHGLAVAMSLLEGDKFKLITPSDYLAHLCNHSGSTNVDAAHAVNEKIVIWVKQSLVHYEALNPRVSVFKFFINTASVRSVYLIRHKSPHNSNFLSVGMPQIAELSKSPCDREVPQLA